MTDAAMVEAITIAVKTIHESTKSLTASVEMLTNRLKAAEDRAETQSELIASMTLILAELVDAGPWPGQSNTSELRNLLAAARDNGKARRGDGTLLDTDGDIAPKVIP